ncbi:condensation domain-containing protein, partial [Maribacter sp. 2-571]|uniref:condensation domain-containing protein n=1 Tax=Maribacter sp. 2-571 TaxID=3417569 RepID=UPI003D3395F5
TKETLRRVPGKGMGYGALRYLHPSAEIRDSLSGPSFDIIFNYLGQIDNVLNENEAIDGAEEFSGNESGENFPFVNKFVIDSEIVDGELEINWGYSQNEYRKGTIAALADTYVNKLKALIEHCTIQEGIVYTPSDYGLEKEVTYVELDSFVNKLDAQGKRPDEIYKLAALQEGMLFHELLENDSEAYLNQTIVDFPKGLDIEVFKKSWSYVFKNHSVFRSSFHYDELGVPVQCTHEGVVVPISVLDYSMCPEQERAEMLDAFKKKDRETRFDLSEAPLVRITLIKT